jgi:hypothetical protein
VYGVKLNHQIADSIKHTHKLIGNDAYILNLDEYKSKHWAYIPHKMGKELQELIE